MYTRPNERFKYIYWLEGLLPGSVDVFHFTLFSGSSFSSIPQFSLYLNSPSVFFLFLSIPISPFGTSLFPPFTFQLFPLMTFYPVPLVPFSLFSNTIFLLCNVWPWELATPFLSCQWSCNRSLCQEEDGGVEKGFYLVRNNQVEKRRKKSQKSFLIYICNMSKYTVYIKNPANGRHQLSRPMRIIGPIQI